MSNWSDVRWFHSVIENGSFSAAARANGTTQATISRRIKVLESEVGGALFVRGLNGATLTKLGEKLRRPADQMALAGRAWDHELSELRSARRLIRVTCGELIGGFLSKNLRHLQEGLDNVDIELKPTNKFVDLASGEADLALRNQRPDKGPLKARKLSSDRYGKFSVFGATAFFSELQVSALEELKQHAWIATSREQQNLQSSRWIAERIGEEQIRFRMNSTALILEATQHNEALALLPRFIGLQEDHLCEVFGPVDGLNFEMWIVRRDEGYADPDLERLIANIETLLV